MKYGWIPDTHDHRDILYSFPFHPLLPLPPLVDLRPQCPFVYDQGDLGSCTGNAIAGALEFDMIKQKEATYTPSRLFIYYNERVMEGTVNQDSGAAIRDGMKSVNRQGACDEQLWPYDISQFTVQPPSSCYDVAAQRKTISYARVAQNVQLMKSCLASGYPFVYGFVVYQSFESAQVAQTGYVPMPSQNEAILGGHAVLCVGYDDAKKVFICKNSWGVEFADKGHFYMPYQYLTNTNLASDFWTMKRIA